MKRRPVSPFSISFLDIMFCGFGAVVLLVLILNTDTVRARNETFSDLSSEVIQLEQEVLIGQDALVLARNTMQATERQQVTMRGESERIIETIRALEIQIAKLENETLASRAHINDLSSDLKTLDTGKKRLGAPVAADRDAGDKVREFRGEGDRQYLTGLKTGGKRVLILVDASASMLDETIINVVRRRNMSTSHKRNAPKWRRTLATVDWLVSNLPPTADFQLYTLAVAGKLSPKPDNILLVTDGLPTRGRSKPSSTTVSAAERLQHFQAAARTLASGIPVNTILLPMEGDAYAAAAFWKLAIDTQGSFMTPSRDWP